MIIELIKVLILLGGFLLGIYKLDEWRKEYIGTRTIDLAENILVEFYKAHDAIKHIRHPSSFEFEHENVTQKVNEDDQSFKARKDASVVFYRYEIYNDIFSKLYSYRYRVMALKGKEYVIPLDDLQKIINKILSSARRLSMLWPKTHFRTEKQRRDHSELIEKYESIFWDDFSDDDPINPELERIQNELVRICTDMMEVNKLSTNYFEINLKIPKFFNKDHK